MKTYNSLMKHREQFTDQWAQMVSGHDPSRKAKPYWEDRCLQQLKMAGEYAKHHAPIYEELIEGTAIYVEAFLAAKGYITEALCLEVEKRLSKLSAPMKALKVHCVSHAHIDMNWMWGYHETVEVVLATLGTMVDLLEEFPDFTYAQSQVSVYKIVADYDPALLEKVKHYVKEGRWEVTAATWVEHDKNMTGSESFVRQLLYAKAYLCDLLDMKPEDICIDFEPDTFGHSAAMPDILSQAGIKYYYHCRGLEDRYLYNWVSEGGATILSYREPVWYNNAVASSAFYHIPMVAKATKASDTLFVYGVGDHGGGPSRQDIGRLKDMATWPLMPTLKFSTYRKYFEAVEGHKEDLTTVLGEMNPVFTGCYTSTSRIKMANHYGENALVSTEFAAAMAHEHAGHGYDDKKLEEAWEKQLFNQFHDILPGCGINFTLEHALGSFQELIARTNVVKRKSLEAIGEQIDTTAIEVTDAGVDTAPYSGFGTDFGRLIGTFGISYSTGLTQRGRYGGSTRLFALHNHTQYPRRENVAVV